MCELLGFSSQTKKNINDYLNEFFGHSVNNPNGWGMANFQDDAVILNTEPVSAENSLLIRQVMENNPKSKTVLAHIRKATVGGVNPKNCHPFVGLDNSRRLWTLIHNGTIFSGLELIGYQARQSGDTDSERILLYLIDKINEKAKQKGFDLGGFERFKVIEEITANLSYRNKLNLIIYDGEQMYVHVNMKNTLYFKNGEDDVLIATVPLDEEGWEVVPMTTLLVFQNGRLKYKGKNHHNEFIDAVKAAEQQFDYNI